MVGSGGEAPPGGGACMSPGTCFFFFFLNLIFLGQVKPDYLGSKGMTHGR